MSTIDETNYRGCARRVIEKYDEHGRIADALVWRTIIGLYEKALASQAAAASKEPK